MNLRSLPTAAETADGAITSLLGFVRPILHRAALCDAGRRLAPVQPYLRPDSETVLEKLRAKRPRIATLPAGMLERSLSSIAKPLRKIARTTASSGVRLS